MGKCQLLKLLSVLVAASIISATDAGGATRPKAVKDIVEYLKQGRLQSAREEYLKITSEEVNQNEVENIVSQVYGSIGREFTVQDILEFTRHLPDAEAIIAVNKLVDRMRSSNYLNNTLIFPISQRVKKLLQSDSFSYLPQAQKTMVTELNLTVGSLAEAVEQNLARGVQRNEYWELKKASQDRQSFLQHLKRIVSLAYGEGSAENFKSVLDISSNVWYYDQVLEVYSSLAHSLKASGNWNSEEMLTLTHEAFQFCDDEDKELPKAVRTSCKTSFRNLFNPDLWRLYEGKKCSIRSTQFGDDLFASEEHAPQVFAWLHDFPDGAGSSAYWTFEPSKTTPNAFRIRNVGGGYLFQDEVYQPDRLQIKVGSRFDKSRTKWALVPQPDGTFWIRHINSSIYLYAAIGYDFDQKRRRVFSWLPGNGDSQCHWNIQCN